jgi:hypothetical protein
MVMRFEVVRGMRGLSQAITVTPSLRAAEGYVEAARVLKLSLKPAKSEPPWNLIAYPDEEPAVTAASAPEAHKAVKRPTSLRTSNIFFLQI